MFCASCGEQINDGAGFCPKCGAPATRQAPSAPGATGPTGTAPVANVPNHLVGAILATLFCCLPFGVVAIVFASQVNTKLAQGDVEGALKASKSAKNWTLASVLSVAVIMVIYLLIAVVGAVLSSL